jgi:hypothetical protein
MPTRRSLASWVTCAVLAVPTVALAQRPPLAGDGPVTEGLATKTRATNRRPAPIEVSPFVSTGIGDSSGVGASVLFPVRSRVGIEVEAEYRRTPGEPIRGTVDNNGLNGGVNLVVDLGAIGRVRPYAIGGGGLEHYALMDSSLARPEAGKTGMSFVVNMGGGVRVPINDRFGIRAEVRWADGWAEGAPESFRIFYGATIGVGAR